MAGSSESPHDGSPSSERSAFREAIDRLKAAPDEPPKSVPGAGAASGAPIAGAPAALDDVCQRLLDDLRKRCPGLVPADPLPPGTAGSVVPVQPDQVGVLLRTAVAHVIALSTTGRPPAQDQPPPPAVLWRDNIDSLLVHIGRISVKLSDGVIMMIIPVGCDQLPDGAGTVIVEIHSGTPERPTGMLAATPNRPEGPDVVVDRWAGALTALAWQALLELASGVAAAAGSDTDGTPLIPVALAASSGGLAVLPQARHPFDRELPAPIVREVR